MRVAEFDSLKADRIQWQENRIMLYGKGGKYGKRSKRRIIPLSERAKKLLEIQFASGNKMLHRRKVQRIVKRVANRAMISKPVSPHILRHTFAIRCIQKGISTRALQEFLGHDHLETTEWYLNLSPEEALGEFQRKW
jgi:integrase/recombinase XerD